MHYTHTNYSCLATLDLGTSYGWYPGADFAVWHGDTDSHCHVCDVGGNSSLWNYTDLKGAISYGRIEGVTDRYVQKMLKDFDIDGDGRIDEHDMASMGENAEKLDQELDEDNERDDFGDPLSIPKHAFNYTKATASGSQSFIIKNFNYGQGMNWTWTQLPPFMAGIHGFVTSPTSNTTVYGVSPNCIARSHDRGDTWLPCWNATGLTGTFSDLQIKDEKTMLVLRNGDVPLRTKDGGESWHELTSCADVKTFSHGALWSWSGKTLVLMGAGGTQTADHPHAAYVWMSTDDGDTWTDETGDLVTMGLGAAQWYEDKFYINSAGQGIMVKTLE
jgi:hypothetical protein